MGSLGLEGRGASHRLGQQQLIAGGEEGGREGSQSAGGCLGKQKPLPSPG